MTRTPTAVPDPHLRRPIRLPAFDYTSPGAYFVTICTHRHQCLFGDIEDGTMRLNPFGQIVRETWDLLPRHYPHVELDSFVVMPNHVHAIIVIVGAGFEPAPESAGLTRPTVRAGFKPAPALEPPRLARAGLKPAPTSHGLSEIVRGFKTFSARRLNELRRTPGAPAWQRNYYEHIIRDETSLNHIRQYIADNPIRWAYDRENPAALAPEPEDAWRS